MNGLFLDFDDKASIAEAVEEYASLCSLEEEWHKEDTNRQALAQLLEEGKGISKGATLDYLKSAYGAPGFRSPSSRRWYFATHPQPGKGTDKARGTSDRWASIIEAARDAVRVQPNMTGEELIVAVGNSVDPPLTPSEEERVTNLVMPGREKRLVEAPEKTPKEERTPETLELIEAEWSRIQQERKEKEEKAKPSKPIPVEHVKVPKETLTEVKIDDVPPFIQPGMPYLNASKTAAKSQREYVIDKCPELAGADYWRAFQQAVQMLRSGLADSDIKEVVENEYPCIEPDIVMKASKGYMKLGSKDSYVDGRLCAQKLVKEAKDMKAITATYMDLIWQGADRGFLKGFQADLPSNIIRLLSIRGGN